MARAPRLKRLVVTRDPEWTLCLTLPITVQSTPNLREHHMAKARRAKAQRGGVLTALLTLIGPGPPMIPIGYALTVHMTRLGGRSLDSDNLDSAFKNCRDGIADWFGIDDGDPIWNWDTFQLTGGVAGIQILIKCAPRDS